MALDSSIISNLRPPAPLALSDPLEQYGKTLQLKTLMGQNQLQTQALSDDAAAREAYQGAGGDIAKLRDLLNKSGNYKAIQALDKFELDKREKESTIGKNNAQAGSANQEQLIRATATHRDQLANVSDPATAALWIQSGYQDPLLAPIFARTGSVQDAISRIPQDPAEFQKWKQQNALGATEFIKQNAPKLTTQNLGNISRISATPGLGGAPQVISESPIGQSPDSVASNATSRLNAAMTRDQAERHFQAGQNSPQYMETDSGLVALPKRPAAGAPIVGAPVLGPNGETLGKPLKPLPPAVNEAVIGNAQSLYSLQKAINLLQGKNVDSAKGDADATGWKGYLPQAILNRVDPTGIDTRAEVADIGSLKIHDRSGAAVTISESPRLMPFIPTATDPAPVAVKKLTRLFEEAKRMQSGLTEIYSKEQGYKPNPLLDKQSKKPASIGPAKLSDAELKRELGL